MPHLCMCNITIDSNIVIPANNFFNFITDGKTIRIACNSHDGVTIDSNYAETLSLMTTTPPPANIIFWNTSIDGQDVGSPRKTILNQDSTDILGTIEITKLTTLFIYFEVDDPQQITDETSRDTLTKWVIQVVGRFIDVYRYTTQQSSIKKFRVGDGFVISFMTSEVYTFSDNKIEGTFSKPIFSFSLSHQMTRGYGNHPLTKTEFDTITTRMNTQLYLSVSERLLLDATEQATLHADYDLAIVIALSAFETFLQQHINDFCTANGITVLKDAAENLKVRVKKLSTEQVHSLLHCVDNIVKVPHNSNKSITQCTEHAGWKLHAYERRNSVVHRGYRGSTEQEYNTAIESIVRFMNKIASLF